MRNHVSSIKSLSLTIFSALVASACVSSASKNTPGLDAAAIPPAAGSSGAFGIVTVNGKQKMYLPVGSVGASLHGSIAVVDVGITGRGTLGAPALITSIDLGTADLATATGGDSSMVVAVSTSSPKIWFIDPTTDTLIATTALDSTYGASNFSGGGGFITGVAIDAANHRAILSTWNGFALLDLGTKAITKVIQAPPTENFGFDSVHGRIVAPFYDCTGSTNPNTGATLPFCGDYKAPDGTPMTDGLNVIDLSDGAVYTYQNAPPDGGARTANTPVGSEPDSASIDPTTQIAVVPSEGEGAQNLIDLSRAVFDKATKSFTAPLTVIPNQSLEGVAIEPSSHYGFFEEEHSSSVGVVSVTQAAAGPAPFVFAAMPLTPDGISWSNMGDPHGVAVTTAQASGHAVGFVVSSDQHWVARVDLLTMAGIGAGADASAGFPDISTAVTYLDSTTPVGGDSGIAALPDAGSAVDAAPADDAAVAMDSGGASDGSGD